jgi:hypothetical protein
MVAIMRSEEERRRAFEDTFRRVWADVPEEEVSRAEIEQLIVSFRNVPLEELVAEFNKLGRMARVEADAEERVERLARIEVKARIAQKRR